MGIGRGGDGGGGGVDANRAAGGEWCWGVGQGGAEEICRIRSKRRVERESRDEKRKLERCGEGRMKGPQSTP